jgi:hypothetical protein
MQIQGMNFSSHTARRPQNGRRNRITHPGDHRYRLHQGGGHAPRVYEQRVQNRRNTAAATASSGRRAG